MDRASAAIFSSEYMRLAGGKCCISFSIARAVSQASSRLLSRRRRSRRLISAAQQNNSGAFHPLPRPNEVAPRNQVEKIVRRAADAETGLAPPLRQLAWLAFRRQRVSH